MSAGSKTNPGGYSGNTAQLNNSKLTTAIPCQIASMLKSQGLEPVWKDWDTSFLRLLQIINPKTEKGVRNLFERL